MTAGRGPRVRDAAGKAAAALSAVFAALFPPACVVCGRAAEPGSAPACALCWHRLPRIPAPRCRRCGATRLLDLPGPDVCPDCEDWPAELPAAASACRLAGPAVRVVHALKYEGAFALAGRMGAAMEPPARRLAGRAGPVLVPVPLAPARRRERGYNQAELLARALASRTGWPVRRALTRRPGGGRQARLGRGARRRNVRHRFRVEEAGTPDRSRPALVVDDVLTTGATAGACARALRGAGFPVAGVVTFARALQRLTDS